MIFELFFKLFFGKILTLGLKYDILTMRHILILPMLRSDICKNVYSRLNIGKCVATLRDAFLSVFLNETRFFVIGRVK